MTLLDKHFCDVQYADRKINAWQMNLVCNYTETFSGHQYLVNCVGNEKTALQYNWQTPIQGQFFHVSYSCEST